MRRSDEVTIRLCGRFEVAFGDRLVGPRLPGRQGRLLFAYLVCNRGRPATRDELIDLLWPARAPQRPDQVLGALLSKVRRAVGPGVIEGRGELQLVLPSTASVDLETASDAVGGAEAALAAGRAGDARRRARIAREILDAGFMPGFDGEWVHARRSELADVRVRALESLARVGLSLGGAALADGEACARELIVDEPLRETGYRLLMELLAERGDSSGALHAYE